jgi:Ran GTPase-activating protein (RanGAP) involved in mRNA processing and transport
MPQDHFSILCPVRGPVPFVTCPDEEVTPLIEHLARNEPVDEAVVFPRGTVLPDGRLDLCKQNLGPSGCRRVIDALRNNTQVRSILLGTDGIGDEGAVILSQHLKSNPELEIVYLGCNGITAQGAELLADSLSENAKVQGLWLKRNPIGDQGVTAIAKLLCRSHSIRVLDLVNTGMTWIGVQSLCRALVQSHCRIERLYLGGNGLDEQSAQELAKVLWGNTTITSLLLNVGSIGNDGAIAIADGLRDNKTLRELGLASNGISGRGIEHLLSAVASHPTLLHLDLGYSPSTKILGARANYVGDQGADCVAHMLEANQFLVRLNLARTEIGEVGRFAIERSLLSNRVIQHCTLDGGLSEEVRSHLVSNQQTAPAAHVPNRDITLIRSVYRT